MTRREAITVSNLAGQMLLIFVKANQMHFADPDTKIGKTYLELCEIRKQIANYTFDASNQLEKQNETIF